MARVLTDTRKRAVASLRAALPLPARYEVRDWHCAGTPADPHESVGWQGTEYCWHCGQTGRPGSAEAA